jgi:hypothetical protein
MALRSPTQIHSFWGVFATAGLPATANVEVGDTAFDTSRVALVVCTAVGPVVWSVVGSGATSLSQQAISLDGTATGGAVAYIGSVYLPASTTLTVAATAYIGGSLVGDTTALSLAPVGGGPAVAAWTRTGTLGAQPLAAPAAVVAGWYDLTLQGTAGSGVAFARGLYLA